MSEEKYFLMHDESMADSKPADESDNHQFEITFLGDAIEFWEWKNRLSDKNFEKMDHDSESLSTSDLDEEEMQFDSEGDLHGKELKFSKENAGSISSRLSHLHAKCTECDDYLNAYLQHIHQELIKAELLKKWERFAELKQMSSELEPFYDALVMIMYNIEKMIKKVKRRRDSLTKRIINMVIRTCNLLENNVDQLMSSISEI